MEIISYIQQPKRKSSVSFFRNTKGSFSFPKRQQPAVSSVSYAYTYPNERHTFKAGIVHESFSVKKIFSYIGKAVSAAGESLSFYKKTILVTLIVSVAGLVSAAVVLMTLNYAANHTGALTINAEDTFDIDSLDKLMSNFALEITSEVDADGNIIEETGSKVNYAALFSQPVEYQTYKVKSGDTISGIAKKFGLTNISTLISVNDIGNVRQLGAGQKLKIPSMDGIIYTVKSGDSLNSIATANNVRLETILDVNELTIETLTAGQQLFLPGVGLDQKTLQSRMGELFTMPITASFRWSSPYGWRADPFTGVQSFHTGTDMACPEGTPILAAMSGRISDVGYNRIYGNYIIINHGNGYQTLYAHMSKTIAKKGQWVSQSTRIGLVGSTGYSTGPHLHFMVYKNGNRIDPMTVLKK